MKFNPDGSLATNKESSEIIILKALASLPFAIGRKTLVDFLLGDEYNPTIEKHNFKEYPFFGIFEHFAIQKIQKYLSELEKIGAIEGDKIIALSENGKKSIQTGSIIKKTYSYVKTEISDEDKIKFNTYKEFLKKLDDYQKKAIISEKKHIACIAGAGTGKTTVLTKRIAHLVIHKKISPEKILAITFTKKARLQMHERLTRLGIKGIHIHTFNSFCEQILRKYEQKLYSKKVRIITFNEKIKIVEAAFARLNQDINLLVKKYYPKKEKQKFIFVQDCFSIIDFYNNNNQEIQPFYTAAKPEDYKFAETLYSVVKYIQAYMSKHGLRDFSDQIRDALSLFRKHSETIPQFENILVDEYQDVNEIQIELLEILSPKNIFCVGDPRQSIYGWRGSKMEYIQDFTKKYPDAEIIYLNKNYRSGKEIISFANKIIEPLHLPDLEPAFENSAEVDFKQYEDAQHEAQAIAQKIKQSTISRNEIFVITRTNKQLEEITLALKSIGIPYTVKSDEQNTVDIYSNEVVVLATAHCVKGLEADEIFLAGCTSTYFPCYGSEHKILDLIKDYYDKRSEELRVLYVAITRAKKKLHVSYYGKKISPFIKPHIPSRNKKTQYDQDTETRLKIWRRKIAISQKIPDFLVLTDQEIKQISQTKPLAPQDLQGIITPHKISRYGEEITAITNQIL